MFSRRFVLTVGFIVFPALTGCMSSRQSQDAVVPRPDAIVNFATLYGQNCAGCHGAKGTKGPAYPLANPVYQAIINEQILHDAIAKGVPGTLMPAFSKEAGGTLTDRQIDVLTKGIRAAWWRSGELVGIQVPPYTSTLSGDSHRGQQVYTSYCSSCHGAPNAEAGKAGSVTGSVFLSLANDRVLRTVIIAGRPDLGHPDWRGGVKGLPPMTDQQVTDLIAWFADLRSTGGDMGTSGQVAQTVPPVRSRSKGGLQ
jgi:cytochrome c oxidase cbb3-type subunit 3/ubiquinol-cytochrome c reductase cytochrome c subunit